MKNIASLLTLMIACLAAITTCGQDRPQQAETARQKIYELGQSISPPEQVGRNAERDLELVAQLKSIKEHLTELEKEYSQEIASGNQPYRNLSGTIQYVRERISQFETAAQKFASLDSIQADADHIRRMTAMAIENQAPAYFRSESDIAIYTRTLAQRRELLEKIGSEAGSVEKAKTLAAALQKEVRQAQTKLLEGIVAQNELPTDNFRGPDREELVNLVKQTWNKQAPEAKILKVGLIGDNWNRTQAWEIQNRTLYKVDRSRLQGYVLVAHDKTTIACRRIQLQRDHTNNDKTTAWLINDPKNAPEPMELILTSKLKP